MRNSYRGYQMSTCEDVICTTACEACTIAICAESLSNCQCSQSPQCDPGCSNVQCNSSNCRCGSSSSVILPIVITITGILFAGVLGVGILSVFGAKSPYYLTFLGSIVLALNLSGLRIDN
jgi:hypothetical protein